MHAKNQILATAGLLDSSYVQIGHANVPKGSNYSMIKANIEILASNEVPFTGGDGEAAFALLGHGGLNTVGNIKGDIEVKLAVDITFRAGKGLISFAQMGHGGNGLKDGKITVEKAENITFTGGVEAQTYAQVAMAG